jgi:hypothetical protein
LSSRHRLDVCLLAVHLVSDPLVLLLGQEVVHVTIEASSLGSTDVQGRYEADRQRPEFGSLALPR